MMTSQVPFECLTVSLGKDCNLKCAYCYSHDKHNHSAKTNFSVDFLNGVKAAARDIAAYCRQQGRPFYFGIQGGGEPLVHFQLLKQLTDMVKKTIEEFSLPMVSFITSNGTMAPAKYKWLARNFSRICLSVDGPADIHDKHRRFLNNRPTLSTLKRTIGVLAEEGKEPVCRSTITEMNAERQVDMVDFLISELGFRQIQFEPIYHPHLNRPAKIDPEIFVRHLMAARKRVRALGGNLIYSGYRPQEPHAMYCHILKNVFFVTPRATASLCLFFEDNNQNHPFTIGYYHPSTNQWRVDHKKINRYLDLIRELPGECVNCRIHPHCTRGCPDICLISRSLAKSKALPLLQSLRCRINRLLFDRKWPDGELN